MRLVRYPPWVFLAMSVIACCLPSPSIEQAQTPARIEQRPGLPEESTPREPTWHPHTQPLQLGEVQVSITRVALGKVPLETITGESSSNSDLLLVWMSLKNVSEERKIDVDGWGDVTGRFGSVNASLSDDLGNTYRMTSFGFGNKIRGVDTPDALYPGKTLVDAAVFEAPVSESRRPAGTGPKKGPTSCPRLIRSTGSSSSRSAPMVSADEKGKSRN